ncbi:hypothetical protein [Micromonospora sp. WMMD975]|uniref:hypothetical protein n=1 Tax=Micromonospora sp. WMMD975 TaxID=3016087 RepID=UPI00249A02BA|nr:hypothetical protein [Micromonospora sp. WMMD975]WFE33711.1 hypothetical protein O7613_30095 [Micromonospora sp. WMMD975]
MIERGSGRTSGLTDWRLMDVLSMWACLHDQDTTGQWKQVAGWRKVCDLALAHLGRLREYRRGLAEAWPPETNAAARAYVGELDQLIERVQHTHDAAAANYDALAAAARAIGSARTQLQPLHDEYATKLQQKRAYEAILADPKAVAGSRLPERPPVTDDDLEQLNVRARGLMTGLSGELQQAQVMLRQPPTRTWPGRDEGTAAPADAPGVPVIPPIVPTPLPMPIKNDGALSLGAGVVSSSPPTAHGVGPILGGTAAVQLPAPPNSNLTPIPPASQHVPQSGFSGSAFMPSLPNASARGPSPDRIGGPTNVSKPPAVSADGASRGTTPIRASPMNGMIGGVPGMGANQPGPSVPQRRINPVGGVIGGGGAGTAPAGAAGSRPGAGRSSQIGGMQGAPPFGGAPKPAASGVDGNGRPFQPGKSDQYRLWDADQPWETEQGVPPIVRPPEDKGPIDPGPAIGFDR